jgi:hypothetical protein
MSILGVWVRVDQRLLDESTTVSNTPRGGFRDSRSWTTTALTRSRDRPDIINSDGSTAFALLAHTAGNDETVHNLIRETIHNLVRWRRNLCWNLF